MRTILKIHLSNGRNGVLRTISNGLLFFTFDIEWRKFFPWPCENFSWDLIMSFLVSFTTNLRAMDLGKSGYCVCSVADPGFLKNNAFFKKRRKFKKITQRQGRSMSHLKSANEDLCSHLILVEVDLTEKFLKFSQYFLLSQILVEFVVRDTTEVANSTSTNAATSRKVIYFPQK